MILPGKYAGIEDRYTSGRQQKGRLSAARTSSAAVDVSQTADYFHSYNCLRRFTAAVISVSPQYGVSAQLVGGAVSDFAVIFRYY